MDTELTLAALALLCTGVALTILGLAQRAGRLRWNYFVGIRTPRTLRDDQAWKRAHARTWLPLGQWRPHGGGRGSTARHPTRDARDRHGPPAGTNRVGSCDPRRDRHPRRPRRTRTGRRTVSRHGKTTRMGPRRQPPAIWNPSTAAENDSTSTWRAGSPTSLARRVASAASSPAASGSPRASSVLPSSRAARAEP
jgi:hypothetical protein